MHMKELLRPDCIFSQFQTQSKKNILQTISFLFSQEFDNLEQSTLFQSFIKREQLGSTAIGYGIAIPHIRVNISTPYACFFQLRKGIDFGATDGTPVDILFALLMPESTPEVHLKLLASLAKRFSEANFREDLRQCHSKQSLLEILTEYNYESIIS